MTKSDPEIDRLKKKVVKSKEQLTVAQLCKKHGLRNFMDTRQYKINSRRLAKALPKEKRQEVLDAYHQGGVMKEMAQSCGVTIDEFWGVILLNTKVITYKLIRKETV